MTADQRDTDFVAAVDRERPLLHGTARLLLDNPRTVDPVLDSVLAHLYGRDLPPANLRLEALRGLVGNEQPGPLPWSQTPAFELVDSPPSAGGVREAHLGRPRQTDPRATDRHRPRALHPTSQRADR